MTIEMKRPPYHVIITYSSKGPTPIAYRGKEGCFDLICTETPEARAEGYCYGWHCARCNEPCSSRGHDCG